MWLVGTVVLGGIFESLECGCGCDAVSPDDGLRVDAHVDQLFCFAQQFGRQHTHAGGAIAHLVVLHLGDVDQILAAALSRWMDLRMVAPSLVTTMSFEPTLCRILFMPLGPSVVLTRSPSATAPTNELKRAFSPHAPAWPPARKIGADMMFGAMWVQRDGGAQKVIAKCAACSLPCLQKCCSARRRVGEAALHSASAKLRLSCSAALHSSQQRVGAAQSRAKRREGRRTKKGVRAQHDSVRS